MQTTEKGLTGIAVMVSEKIKCKKMFGKVISSLNEIYSGKPLPTFTFKK